MKRHLRFLTCLLLCAALVGGLSPVASAAKFEDVPSRHWTAESINRCVKLGFFKGKSETFFGLGQEMTRGQFVVVLCRFFGWETTTPTRPIFPDVPVDAWYAGAVEAACAHGAVTLQRDEFRPDEPITREELTVMLVRALGYGTLAGLDQGLSMPFEDVTTNAGYINMARNLGVINGVDEKTFAPQRTAPREQVAVMLMRVYDRLNAAAPDVCAIVSELPEEPSALAGLSAAAIPAARLNYSGSISLSTLPAGRNTELRDAVQLVGVKALLHVTGSGIALNGKAEETAAVLADAVESGGYDGLYLDIPKLTAQKKSAMTELAQTLDAALGDKLLYLTAEAPAHTGKSYDGYDYAALSAAADHLVLRLAPYQGSGSIMIAPTEPLEEVYYALASLKDKVNPAKLSLQLTTTPSAWSGTTQRTLAEGEWEELLASEQTRTYYSERYAAAYLMGKGRSGSTLTVWYPDSRGAEAREQLAQAFGTGGFCLAEWNTTAGEMLEALK